MRARLRDERGWAVVIALFTMTAMILVGLATYAYVGGQQGQTRDERVRVSAFQLSEEAFNSGTNFLNAQWPTQATAYPTCTDASTGTTCPDTASVSNGLDSTDFGAGQYTWSTEVHDNGGPTASYYSDTTTRAFPGYDQNADGSVWIRSQGNVRGRTRTMVALVKAQPAAVKFPTNVLTAGYFGTGNTGKKVMIDTRGNGQGGSNNVGGVVVRCTPSGGFPNTCLNYYPSKGQVSPNAVQSSYAGGNAVTSTDLQKLRDQAIANGTDYTTCPASLTGAMVFIEGPANCSYTGGNSTFNSASSPGMLVIVNGTLTMTAATYYGVVYMANQQGSTGNVATIQGNGLIRGALAVDGGGGALIGSDKANLIYDSNVFRVVQGKAGVAVIQNTWRLL